MDQSGPEERRRGPISVHWVFDDYPLTAMEVRAVVRVSRRGTCYESFPSMATDWFVSTSTVRRAFFVLVAIKALTETPQEGLPTVYNLNPFQEWIGSSDLEAGLKSIDKNLPHDERKRLRKKIRASIRQRIDDAVKQLRDQRREKKKRKPPTRRTPTTTDRGTHETLVNKDRGGLALQTGDASHERQATPATTDGPPLPPRIDEGIPSEGFPIEGNSKKVITHTEAEVASSGRGSVCVTSSIDLIDLDQEEEQEEEGVIVGEIILDRGLPISDERLKAYAKAHEKKPFLKRGIYDPPAWLTVAKRTRQWDAAVLEWEQEEEELAQACARAEAERIQQQAELDATNEQLRAKREEEKRLKAEEWERGAPERERERLAKQAEDDKAIADLKRILDNRKKAKAAAAR